MTAAFLLFFCCIIPFLSMNMAEESCMQGILSQDGASFFSIAKGRVRRKEDQSDEDEEVRQNLPDPGGCAVECLKLNSKWLVSHKVDMVVSASGDPYDVNTSCQVVSNFPCSVQSCLRTCPTSTLSKLFIEFIASIQLACQQDADDYQDIANSLTCYQKNEKLAIENCNACDSSKSFHIGAEASVEPHILTWPPEIYVTYVGKNKTLNTEILRGICGERSCMENCSRSIFENACGSSQYSFVRKMRTAFLVSLVNMLLEVRAVETDLPECAVIQNLVKLEERPCS